MEEELHIAHREDRDEHQGGDDPAEVEDPVALLEGPEVVEVLVDLDELVERHVAEDDREERPADAVRSADPFLHARDDGERDRTGEQQKRRPPRGEVLLLAQAEPLDQERQGVARRFALLLFFPGRRRIRSPDAELVRDEASLLDREAGRDGLPRLEVFEGSGLPVDRDLEIARQAEGNLSHQPPLADRFPDENRPRRLVHADDLAREGPPVRLLRSLPLLRGGSRAPAQKLRAETRDDERHDDDAQQAPEGAERNREIHGPCPRVSTPTTREARDSAHPSFVANPVYSALEAKANSARTPPLRVLARGAQRPCTPEAGALELHDGARDRKLDSPRRSSYQFSLRQRGSPLDGRAVPRGAGPGSRRCPTPMRSPPSASLSPPPPYEAPSAP